MAQTAAPGDGNGAPGAPISKPAPLRIADQHTDILSRGLHHQVVSYRRKVQGTNGLWQEAKSQYVQLESGLNRQDAQGNWVPVTGSIEIVNDGAQFIGAEHAIAFRTTPDVSDALTITFADGNRMVSHVAGLAYYDRSSGDSVMLASVKPVVGQLQSGQDLVYPDCFTDNVQADLVFHVTRSSLSQDVVIHSALPLPSAYGLNEATTDMELWTEWIEAPEPASTDSPVPSSPNSGQANTLAGTSADDDRPTLDFGLFKIGLGKAFDQGAGEGAGLDVKKYWRQVENRQFLIETLSYASAQPWLQTLPKPAGGAMLDSKRILRHQASARPLPGRPKFFHPSADPKGGILARNDSREKGPGFVWDYVSTLGSSVTNLVCRADTTYFISGTVNLTGNLTLEGGTVLKFESTGTATSKLSLTAGSTTVVTCPTGLYHVAIVTAKDDDSVGDILSGSSGTPSGYYASPFLTYTASSANNAALFSNLQVRYANSGLELINNNAYGIGHTLRNCQFAQGGKGVRVSNCTVNGYNLLFYNMGTTAFDMPYASVVNAQHITVNTSGYVANGGTLTLLNSIIYNVTNPGSGYPANVVTPTSSPFQPASVATGNNYLAASTYQDMGTTTGLDSTLAADLKLRTTVMPNGWGSISLPPTVARDVNTPDLGYHYDAVDAVTGGMEIGTGQSVNIPAGYVISGWFGHVFRLNGGSITDSGIPTNRVWLIQNPMFDELGYSYLSGYASDLMYDLGGVTNGIQLRFCNFSVPAGSVVYRAQRTTPFFRLDDCEVYGGSIIDDVGFASGGSRSIVLRNNLFSRVAATLNNTGNSTYPGLYSIPVIATNNTFAGCTLALTPASDYLWTWRNNLFDSCSITQSASSILDGFNAYYGTSSTNRLAPVSASDVTSSSAAPFAAGPLGNYYLTQTAAAVNAGSGPADVANYFFYTTATTQALEGQSRLDIGYHYVGLSSSAPVTSNGGPGYLNDSTGIVYLNAQSVAGGNGPTQGYSVFITRPVNGQNHP